MTVVETLLVYVGIPLAIVLFFAVLTIRPGKGEKKLRYKPGQPWDHEPIWYEPHHGATGGHGGGHGAGHGAHALGAGSAPAARPYGGARGTW